ncbi:MAG: type II toxin-antitoxin system HicA family toxin [Gammaproteobacteria bacterium]|nr:type II toxin-antitoxin system HicA family toxin [Gammaproteobacteria bacterium]MYD80603.1 type II toxin-antitoxin system HicA family toxin [Gammaproteobacteria bacterium]
MKIPRDLSGEKLASLLERHYGYQLKRSKGSHMILTSKIGSNQHTVTVPRHRSINTGTLDGLLNDVANSLNKSKKEVRDTLFG